MVYTIHSKCCDNELHENKAVRMKMHLATQRLHKCGITDIQHAAAKSMRALKFVLYSCININLHNTIKTFCSECFKLYVETHQADIWRCLQVNHFYVHLTAFSIPRYIVKHTTTIKTIRQLTILHKQQNLLSNKRNCNFIRKRLAFSATSLYLHITT